MKISVWQTLLFIALIVGASWLVFPGPRQLVSIYIQDNKGQLAKVLLDQLLVLHPDDPDLNLEAANLAQFYGESDKAISLLARVMQLRPGRKELVLRMADWREWAGQYKEAEASLEDALKLMPEPNDRKPDTYSNRRDVLIRLLDHYTYAGEPDGMYRTVQRLIPLDRYVMANMIAADEPLKEVSKVVDTLSAVAAKGDDPVTRSTLVDAYIIRRGYMDDVTDDQGGKQREGVFTTDFLERIVRGGMTQDALQLAQYLDKRANSASARLAVAVDLGGYGANNDAEKIMDALFKERPNDTALLRGLAELAMNANLPLEAVRHLERLVKLEPANTDAKWFYGEALIAAGRFKEAFQVISPLPVKSIGEANLIVDAAGGTNNADAVAQAATQVAEQAKDDSPLGIRLADAWLNVNRPREAWLILRTLAADSGGDPAIIRMAVQAASQTNDPATLREVLALIERPDFADAQVMLEVADLLVGNNELKGAAKIYERYLARNPGDRKIALTLAQVQSWREAPDLAFAVIERLLTVYPGDKALQKLAASYAEQAGKDNDAFRIYAQLFRENPKDRKAREDFMRLAEWTGKTAESANLLAEDSDREPKNAQKARQAAEAFLGADEAKRALPYLERALALKGDDIALRRLLADTLGGLGFVDRQAATLEPLAARGLLTEDEAVLVAQNSLDRKQPQKALALLARFENMKPVPWDAGALLVQTYTLLNRQDATRDLMRRLKSDYETDPERLSAIGDMAVLNKRLDFALDCYAAALRVDPRNRAALKGQAQIYAWNNDATRAIKGFENYRVQHPSDIEARYQLGELYFTTDHEGEAFGEYKKTLSLIRQARKARAAAKTAPGSAQP